MVAYKRSFGIIIIAIICNAGFGKGFLCLLGSLGFGSSTAGW